MEQLLLFEDDLEQRGLFVIEEMVHPENLRRAHSRVKRNGGVPGVDGMTVDDLGALLHGHWHEVREQLLSGCYRPQPVLRREIPKPGGGLRKLGIPTVLASHFCDVTQSVSCSKR